MDKPFSVALTEIAGVPDHIREALRELNITTAEEVVALAAVDGTQELLAQHLGVPVAELAQYVEAVRSQLPASTALAVAEPNPHNFGMGALEPPAEAMLAAGPYEAVAAAVMLPASVNYIGRMPAIRNQASRGTCVGHACTALNEDYSTLYRGSTPNLSEQCLYSRSKDNDGIPNAEGTWIRVAMDCLERFGEATETCEPYNPNAPTNQPAAHSACCGGGSASWKLAKQQLNQNSVDDIKAALADNKVVAFAIPAYDSWVKSAAVVRTGNITMALPGEQTPNGHAMLFVGYQDDAGTPGGGYFILRNSWGATTWGYQCTYGAGYGTLPYKYMADVGREAWTYVKPATDVAVALYRYMNAEIGDHFYTTDWNELGTGNYGWNFESIQCYIHTVAAPGRVPLYRYMNAEIGDHFYTTDWNELGSGKYGWNFEFIGCYVHGQPAADPGAAGGVPTTFQTAGAAQAPEDVPATFRKTR
jgi:C1A family cysteine protease